MGYELQDTGNDPIGMNICLIQVDISSYVKKGAQNAKHPLNK